MGSIVRQHGPGRVTARRVKQVLLAVVAVALVLSHATPAAAQVTSETALSAPVAAGITLKVVHGYNDPLPNESCVIGRGPDHCGNQKYGLDLAPQNTSDKRILAPFPGKVGWKSGDCLGIATKDNYNLNICHFGSFKVNQSDPVGRGQHLGDRSTSWIHLSLDDRIRQPSSKPAVPFNGAHTLEGKALNPQADNARNQHNNTTTVSTNGGSTPPPTASCSVGQFRAEYFNNRTLSGNPILVRCESRPNHDWGGGGPGSGVPNDNFSVRWTGRHNFDGATYTFIARADDGIRVYVDGTRIVDAWRDEGPTEYRASRNLSAGQHQVKVEFYENGGGAVAPVRWEKGSAPTPNPGPAPKPAPPMRTEVLVDDRAGGFSKGGQDWWEASIGYGSHMFWTYVNGNAVSSWGEWRANLAGGNHGVYVFVPRDHATTRNARYEIFHNGGTATRTVNQNSYFDAWVSLGTYSFSAGDTRRVRLTDATGEAGNTRLKVGFDAMRFAPR